MDWVRQVISVVSTVVEFIASLLPAGMGVLVVGAFLFLSAVAIKRVVI